ncbi:hypothetical protein K439DRAFT_697941 [Ramaria rubella]|nr:hypothetical protein K439DRAFT_697941 [Ramaria rubella]
MVLTKLIFFTAAGFLALTVEALPLQKRIAQTIADSTQKWVQACTAAGGAEQCGTTSQNAFMTLLAGAGDCDQQNAADAMIDLAKTLNNDATMISLSQIFAQQARNSPNKLSVNYCQQAPKNSELNGLFQCQFQGVDPQTFTNNVKVGGPGTIPFGLSAPLSPAGSCKANPQGGIPDGSQLVDLTQNPGVGSAGGNSNSTASTSNAGSSPDPTSSSSSADSGNMTSSSGGENGSASDTGATVGSNSTDSSGSSDGSNAAAATVTVTQSIVTVTVTDAATPTGSGGSPDSSDSATGSIASASAAASATVTATANSAAGTGGFQLKNGQDAQAQNAKFASLTASSSCNEGDQACVDNGFAQCVSGKFVTTQCASGTQCFALPLVNSPGTSIACTTPSDASSRIQATGATGGVTGTS